VKFNVGKGEETARRLLRLIAGGERVITFAAFLVMIAVVFADVVNREITGTGLHWARQAGVYAHIFVVMFGIGIASAEGAHLRPRFADRWLPRGWDPLLERLQELLMALFCLGFALVAASVVVETYELQERAVVLRNLVWPFQLIVPMVFLVAAVRHGLFAAFPQLRPAEIGAVAGMADAALDRGAD
jgi:TRAP-type C4-dicarboxylate transport system permease small subunit